MLQLRSIVRVAGSGVSWVACCVLGACATGGGAASTGSRASGDDVPRARDFAARFAPPAWPAPNDVRAANGAPGPGYWQQRCDYTMHVMLDEAARSIVGRSTIVYTNNSPQELSSVWLHLEQNLFRPDSLGAQMTGPGDRFGNRDGFRGGVQVIAASTGARADGLPDVSDALEVHVYDTVARIDLPAPIAPRGGTVSLSIVWTAKVPGYGSDRLGIDDVRDGPIFQLAQWFPAVAKFDDVHGWNTLPYLGTGEFYTDFGDFDVMIDVPDTHLVAATGELGNEAEVLTARQVERLSAARSSAQTVTIRGVDEIGSAESRPRSDDGRLTWRFRAENVRTFAWASSAAFAWDACILPGAGPGSDGVFGRGGGVLCQSFYPREAVAQWGKSTQMVRQSIEHYSRKWYAYPYPTATNVNGIVGGMEYPMVAFCRARDDERALWGVTTHELGHNWFPMIVNTDERRHAWMDEGFNTFMNYYHALERNPDELPRRGHPRRWAREQPRPFAQPVDTPPDLLLRGTLGVTQYAKPAVGLVLLREGILGEERFDSAFREYIRRWAFKSPRPWDFARTIEDVAGMDLGWFWRGWFYGTGVLDQAVTGVMQAEGENRNARVTIANLGELVMPVTFRVDYTDGTSEVRQLPVQVWAQGDTWTTTWDVQGRRIKSVTIDPDEAMPDVEPRNNVWR
ncbi:MAG: M1 family metallopeptidase [Phycisphaeraceae bacterium]|nr:M1 family metallopeptidase [Phycisphaeraceae bacterium]